MCNFTSYLCNVAKCSCPSAAAGAALSTDTAFASARVARRQTGTALLNAVLSRFDVNFRDRPKQSRITLHFNVNGCIYRTISNAGNVVKHVFMSFVVNPIHSCIIIFIFILFLALVYINNFQV